MKKFYKKFIAPVLAALLWLVLMILPYCISKLIVDKIETEYKKKCLTS